MIRKYRPLNSMAAAVGGVGRMLSTPRGPRLSILIFHRVLAQSDPLLPGEPDARQFEQRLRWVSSAFRVMPLVEASRRLRDGSLPVNAACITFDDGYADNMTIATPILAKLRLHATFFIATGFLDGGRMWNDTVTESVRLARGPVLDLSTLGLGTWPCSDDTKRVAAIGGLIGQLKYLPQAQRTARVAQIADVVGLPAKSDLMMTRDQVRTMRRYGMSIGGHTVTHPILTTLTLDEARREIVDGRRDLEETVGDRIKTFAYPNGKPLQDYDHSHVELVRELGFDAAVSTAWGVSKRDSDRFQLARFTPWDANTTKFGLRLVHNMVRGTTSKAA